MSNELKLLAENRTDKGKGASRRLRRTGKVPAILYGGGRDPRSLTMDHDELSHQLDNQAFYSSILTITVGKKSQPCILKDLQRHPARNQILHVDLLRVLEDQVIRVNVPIRFLNEDVAVGVKQQGGAISHLMTEVEVSCLPKHLPEYLEVDMGPVEIDQVVTLSEIEVPEGVEIPELAQAEAQDRPVANIHHIRVVEIEEEVEVEGEEEIEAEGEAEGEEAGPEEEEGKSEE